MNEIERRLFWEKKPDLVVLPQGIEWGGAVKSTADVIVSIYASDTGPVKINGKLAVASIPTLGSSLESQADLEAFQEALNEQARVLLAWVEEQNNPGTGDDLLDADIKKIEDAMGGLRPAAKPRATLTPEQEAAIAASKSRTR